MQKTKFNGRKLAVFFCALAVAFPTLSHANPRMVVDVATGRVIEHEDAFRKWYPASLTKMMTAYSTFKAIRAGEVSLESIVTMS